MHLLVDCFLRGPRVAFKCLIGRQVRVCVLSPCHRDTMPAGHWEEAMLIM